jgi:DNA-binding transcriptional LysR family regulator
MARLESETGAKLMERAGRGIRLTEAGRLLAERAEEILGRLDAAEAELAAHVGLRQEKVRLAAFGSALATLAAAAGAALRAERAGTDISLTQAEPAEALRMLRVGEADVALIFRYVHEPGQGGGSASGVGDILAEEDLRYEPILDEPVYLITPADRSGNAVRSKAAGAVSLADYAGDRWIAGCERCQDVLIRLCRSAGFTPDIAVTTDDYVATQALVAAGLGTAILPGLALRALRHPEVGIAELAGTRRQVFAVSYGGPPERRAAAALLAALASTASQFAGGQAKGAPPLATPAARLLPALAETAARRS